MSSRVESGAKQLLCNTFGHSHCRELIYADSHPAEWGGDNFPVPELLFRARMVQLRTVPGGVYFVLPAMVKPEVECQ